MHTFVSNCWAVTGINTVTLTPAFDNIQIEVLRTQLNKLVQKISVGIVRKTQATDLAGRVNTMS